MEASVAAAAADVALHSMASVRCEAYWLNVRLARSDVLNRTVAHPTETDTIPEGISTTLISSSLLISSPLTGIKTTLIERKVIKKH